MNDISNVMWKGFKLNPLNERSVRVDLSPNNKPSNLQLAPLWQERKFDTAFCINGQCQIPTSSNIASPHVTDPLDVIKGGKLFQKVVPESEDCKLNSQALFFYCAFSIPQIICT